MYYFRGSRYRKFRDPLAYVFIEGRKEDERRRETKTDERMGKKKHGGGNYKKETKTKYAC